MSEARKDLVFFMDRQADLLDQQNDDIAAKIMREGVHALKYLAADLAEQVTRTKAAEAQVAELQREREADRIAHYEQVNTLLAQRLDAWNKAAKLKKALALAENDLLMAKANWDAACNDLADKEDQIAKLKKALAERADDAVKRHQDFVEHENEARNAAKEGELTGFLASEGSAPPPCKVPPYICFCDGDKKCQ